MKEIRNKVISLKPDLIIRELDFEEPELKKKFKVVPLEPSNKIGKKYPKDLKRQFKIREKEMKETIQKYLNKYKNIVIVLGDAHIRETNEYFGNHDLNTFLKNTGAKIIRSKYKEIG